MIKFSQLESRFMWAISVTVMIALVNMALGYCTAVVPVSADGKGFFDGDGRILLHILVFGFVTMIITTYLKLTGRGEMIPLIVFIGGCVILNELMGLFRSLYQNIVAIVNM